MKTIALPLLVTMMLSATAGSVFAQKQAVPYAVSERYSLKVVSHPMAPAEFTLKINGEVVGSYDDDAQVDISDRLKKGKNTIIVNWKAAGKFTNQFAKSILTIGSQRNGKWSTVVTVTAKQMAQKGTRTTTISAR